MWNSTSTWRRLFTLALIASVAGCASQKYATQETPDSLEAFTRWELQGKLGVRTPEDAHSANLIWQQLDDDYLIQIHGPLGRGRIRIEKSGRSVTLTDGDEQHSASTAEAMLYETTGLDFPVRHLVFWVRGLPSPKGRSARKLMYDESGQISTFEQAGWQIEYRGQQQNAALTLPQKILVSNGDYRLTIVAKSWRAI